ncbi:unnamed protein product [Discosporangium mesarthrocarpum]
MGSVDGADRGVSLNVGDAMLGDILFGKPEKATEPVVMHESEDGGEEDVVDGCGGHPYVTKLRPPPPPAPEDVRRSGELVDTSMSHLLKFQPAGVLRQSSKYFREDLVLAKKRQLQRSSSRKTKVLTFADEHGDRLYETRYLLGLYYSKEGVASPNSAKCFCTIS